LKTFPEIWTTKGQSSKSIQPWKMNHNKNVILQQIFSISLAIDNQSEEMLKICHKMMILL